MSDPLQVKQVACGDVHALALTTDARVFSWGCNASGLLDATGQIRGGAGDGARTFLFVYVGNSQSCMVAGRLGYPSLRPVTVPREIRALHYEQRFELKTPRDLFIRVRGAGLRFRQALLAQQQQQQQQAAGHSSPRGGDSPREGGGCVYN